MHACRDRKTTTDIRGRDIQAKTGIAIAGAVLSSFSALHSQGAGGSLVMTQCVLHARSLQGQVTATDTTSRAGWCCCRQDRRLPGSCRQKNDGNYLRGPPQCGSPSSCGAGLAPPGVCPAAHAGACIAAGQQLVTDMPVCLVYPWSKKVHKVSQRHHASANMFMHPSQMLPQALGPTTASVLLIMP